MKGRKLHTFHAISKTGGGWLATKWNATGPKMSYEYWTQSGMTIVIIIHFNYLDTKFIHPSHYKKPKVLVLTHGSTDGSREKENIHYAQII